MRPTAYAYSRYSNAVQGRGDSLRRQLKASRDFAEKYNLDLDDTLVDRGVSGYTGDNRLKGALGSFIRRVEAGDIAPGSYLLCDSWDRISREGETVVLNMLTNLTMAGIKVVNLSEEHILDQTANMGDYMRVLIDAGRSYKESLEKSRKVRLARAEERRRARADKTPATPVGPHWLKLVTGEDGKKSWEPIKERVDVVREVFDLKEAGLGDQHIAKTFNGKGTSTPTGRGRWFNSTVASISTSIAVIGHYQPYTGHPKGATRVPDGEPIADFYPPIIDPDQFHRVQAIRAGRRNVNARPAVKGFPNLLVGLVQCGECGGVVGFLKSTFPKKPDWKPTGALRCNGVSRGLCGNRSRVPYEPLEADLLPFVSSLPVGNVKAAYTDDQEVLALEGKRLSLASKIAILLDQLEDSAAVSERLRQRERELSDLDGTIATLKAKAIQARATVPQREAIDALDTLRRDMAEASGEALYAIRAKINSTLRQVVTGGFVMDGDGKIVVRVPVDQARGKVGLFGETATGGRLRWEISNRPWVFGRDWKKVPGEPVKRLRADEAYTPVRKRKPADRL